MAKIDWVFQNENGTNLNRYIATNVATGEKITFDLLRGGNISITGTPLDASTMNSLINAINQNYDEFTTLNTKVTNIGNQVVTNTKDISSINTTLGNHNNRISANANNIRNNSYNIDTNATNISDLQKSVENLNDTIIEVQQSEGVINLGELSENPYSATNSTLDGLIKSGIYSFTHNKTPYLMLMRYNKESDWQQVIYLISKNGSTFVFVRRKDTSGISYTPSEQLTTTKYVDNKFNSIDIKKYEHNVVLYYYQNNNPNFIEPNDVLINVKILNTNSNEMSIGDFKSYILTLPKKTVSGVTKFIQATGIYYKSLNDGQGNYEYGTIFGVYNAITNTNLGIKTIYGEYDYSYSKLTLMDTVIEI